MSETTSTIPPTTVFEGPFPTDFFVPSDCSGISAGGILAIDVKPTCLPENFNPDPNAYYSPGTGCPSGYTAQDSCTRSSGSTTTITCCPKRGDLTLQCVDDPQTLEGEYEHMFCTWSAGDQEMVLFATDGNVEVSAVTMSGHEAINAYGLRMVYEPTDIVRSEEGGLVPERTGYPESSVAQSILGRSMTGSGGLPTGEIVAISVVVPIIAAALAFGVFYWYQGRKHSRPRQNAAPEKYAASAASGAGSGAARSYQSQYLRNSIQRPEAVSVNDGIGHPRELQEQTFVSQPPSGTQQHGGYR